MKFKIGDKAVSKFHGRGGTVVGFVHGPEYVVYGQSVRETGKVFTWVVLDMRDSEGLLKTALPSNLLLVRDTPERAVADHQASVATATAEQQVDEHGEE